MKPFVPVSALDGTVPVGHCCCCVSSTRIQFAAESEKPFIASCMGHPQQRAHIPHCGSQTPIQDHTSAITATFLRHLIQPARAPLAPRRTLHVDLFRVTKGATRERHGPPAQQKHERDTRVLGGPHAVAIGARRKREVIGRARLHTLQAQHAHGALGLQVREEVSYEDAREDLAAEADACDEEEGG
ncbi:hypothetical protein BC830DRAFT_209505 [Chytriomyces sp. MP71]|nr:hypothetical protein BC830DRAFT_209505 [Chytriomyces sp. MP71]